MKVNIWCRHEINFSNNGRKLDILKNAVQNTEEYPDKDWDKLCQSAHIYT